MLEKKIFDFCLWLVAGLALLIILTSCSPLANARVEFTPTPNPSATAKPSTNLNISQPSPSPITCTVTTGLQAGRVNLRSGPGTSWAVIRVLIEAERLQVIEAGQWLKVQAHGRAGYINSKFCKIGD